MSAAWSGDLTVTEAVDAVVDPDHPENNAPARIVAEFADPSLIIEAAPWVAGQITVTVVMAGGAPLPAQVGANIAFRTRVT
jgi:hypothetical protein